MKALASLAFLLLAPALIGQSLDEAAKHYAYDRFAPLNIRELKTEDRGGVRVIDLTYAGQKGPVPAWLVVPAGKGRHPAIVWAHWMMPGSEVKNRNEFLPEAVLMARHGVVSLLVDAPMVRPGYVEPNPPPAPFSPESTAIGVQAAVDIRRGLDLLLARPDVDPKRIAYVGHSFHAGIGGVLAGVEKRIQSFVLMAGVLSDEIAVKANDAQAKAFVQQAGGMERAEEILRNNRWNDPGFFLAHSAPSAVFIQAGRNDSLAGEPYATQFAALVNGPKKLQIYDAPHSLNAAARADRIAWLAQRFKLATVPAAEIARVPDVVQPPPAPDKQ